ncbi:hypothetical protein GALMADRAFT_224250 [Galerina marginata CBS 339.88]|uniref:Uncharacterized protein n=1 Tax=Galerina marginata (strain CBS 339.88) TaxID=685588 RepID=A0A067T758_GALM3|nr:hypothetical protein GALMADRAFT_224250 [Galerina marginata CBS 339.88]
MQTRRSTGLTPLAIVLPHPPLPRRRSSLLSLNSAASPHTPRSCPSPSLPIFYPANRKSTDSWNSSNADDMDFEWKQDQILLLSRTLDALPAHLVTPFNGPVPPSNLLDKIARGVSQAKGPAEWLHSIRATRVKLLELARSRAKEEALAERQRQVIAEEVEIDDGSHHSNYSYFHDGEEKPVAPRRPLYRQSSMDFIKPSPADIKDNANIARLSNRLQRSDRLFPNPSYHPYSRLPRSHAHAHADRRSSSPPHPTDVPALINPSTPSSSTLNSFSSLSSAPRVLRRSASTLSSGSLFSSSSSGMPLPDPRLQRVKRSDSFCSGPPAPPPKDTPRAAGMKRAPSYGTLAQEARQEAAATDRVHARKLSGSYPSSDEEEKARTRRAKKMRTKTGAATIGLGGPPASPSVASPPPSSVPPSPAAAGTVTAPTSPVPVSVAVARAPMPPPKDKERPSHAPRSKSKSVDEGKVKSPKAPSATKSSKSSSNTAKVDTSGSKVGKTTDKAKDKTKDKVDKAADPTHTHKVRAPKMNLQRNPSMFGAELPHLREKENVSGAHGLGPGLTLSAAPSAFMQQRGAPHGTRTPTKMRSPSPALRTLSPVSAVFDMHTQAQTPPSPSPSSPPLSPSSGATQKVRTLRRVRRLAPARRISFGSLIAPGDEADADGEGDMDVDVRDRDVGLGSRAKACLGSAFQLI